MKKLMLCAALCLAPLALLRAEEPKAGEVIVTATRTENQVKDISGHVTVIGSREISESNAKTADQILKSQSGLDIQGGGQLASKIRFQVRGLSGNYGAQRVLIMLDNRPVNEEYMGDADFRFLPADSIERIEIVRGPASALYGSNAMGGVIHLITKNGAQAPMLSLKSQAGGFNSYGAVFQHGRQAGNLDYFISAGQQATDGYLKNTDGTDRNWTAQNISTRASWKLNQDEAIDLSLGLNNGIGIEENFKRIQDTNYLNLAYRAKWSRDSGLTARIYRNGLEQDLKWKFGFTGSYEQSTLGAQIQRSFRPAEKHLLTAGIDAKQQSALVTESNGIIDETVNSQAVYAQDEIWLRDDLIATLGLRYDRHDEFGGQTSPKLGLVYHLNDRTSLRGAIGKGYREPAVSDLFLPLTPYGPVTYQGNANLKPETLWSYELGLDHKFTEDLSARLTVYLAQFQDAWDYMLDPDTVSRPRNIARQSSQGMEAEAKYRLSPQLDCFVNYTYTDARYQKDISNPAIKGKHVEETLLNQGNLGLRFQPGSGPITLNLAVNASGPRYTDPENARANKLPQYLAARLGLLGRLSQTISFFLTAHNLFDRTYRETIDYEQPGRWFEGGLAIEF